MRAVRLTCFLVLTLTALFAAPRIHAFSTFNDVGPWGVVHVGGTVHQRISSIALTAAGISEANFQIIDDGNTGQDDVTHYNFTEAAFHHFDDNLIRQSMAYVKAQRELAVLNAKNAASDPVARRDALLYFGELLHAAQDFYSHMNYVELHLKRNPSLQPSQIEIVNWSNLPRGLRSGYFYFKNHTTNEMTMSRDSTIVGLGEHGVRGPFLSAAEFALRRQTFADILAYATDLSFEVFHGDLNKDNERTPEGATVVPATGKTLHAYAFDLAVRETERQWKLFEEEIRRTYRDDADAIIRALKGREDYQPLRIDVHVRDQETRDPIAGAGVTLGNVSTVTSAAGLGILRSPVGTFSLAVTAQDYDPSPPVDFRVSSEDSPLTRTILLVPSKSVTIVTVRDDRTGDPIDGADVTFHNEERASGINLTERTGPDGSARMRSLRGQWTGWINARGYIRHEFEHVVGTQPEETLDLRLTAYTVPITIQVLRSEDGKPIQNATVTIEGRQLTTDDEGKAFISLPPGPYEAAATARRRTPAATTFTAAVGKPHRSTIKLAVLAGAAVRVVGTGEEVPRATVTLRQRGRSLSREVDAQGIAAFAAGPGNWTVRVTAPGYRDATETLTVGDDRIGEARVRLEPRATPASVRVTSEGRAVAGARVTMTGSDRRERAGLSDASGSIQFDVAPGAWTVAVSADGYRSQTQPLAVREGSGGSIEIRLVAAASATPAAATGGAAAGSTSYMPLQPGSRWVYRYDLSRMLPAGAAAEAGLTQSTMTEEVEIVGNRIVTRSQTIMDIGDPRQPSARTRMSTEMRSRRSISAEGKSVRLGGGSGAVAMTMDARGFTRTANATYRIEVSPAMVLLADHLDPGAVRQWSNSAAEVTTMESQSGDLASGMGEMGDGPGSITAGTNAISTTSRVGGVEAVRVPAGLFQGCVIVEITHAPKHSNGATVRTSTRQWFARGVGLIKEATTSSISMPGMPAMTITMSKELTEYRVP